MYDAMIANAPDNHHFFLGVIALNAPTASERVLRPKENSASITGIPNRNTQPIYINKNAAPPLACVSAGNLHTLPNQTADPTVAAINPIFELN